MQNVRISERSIRRGRVSWEQSQEDLKLARSFIKSAPQKSCLLSIQASINAISSILEVQGHFQLPAFSCVELLDQSIPHAQELEGIRPQCYLLDSSMERDVMGGENKQHIGFTVAYAGSCHKAGRIVLARDRSCILPNTLEKDLGYLHYLSQKRHENALHSTQH